MKKYCGWLLTVTLLVLYILTGCSSNEESKSSKKDSAGMPDAKQEMDKDYSNAGSPDAANDAEGSGTEETATSNMDTSVDRMVVYTADIYLTVKNSGIFEKLLEEKVAKEKGYIVSKNNYETEEEKRKEGTIIFRIPQKSFHPFLEFLGSGENIKVESQDISGEDVTEEYVDLSSRLKAKEAVEKRLYDFMGNAQKTDDLLKISGDLDKVQSEIEQIKGRMNYLDNQSSLSTITLNYSEKNYDSSGIHTEDLETWGKIKQAFGDSLQGLITVGSAILVFIVGYLPVWIVLLAVAALVWGAVKVFRGRNKNSDG